MKSFIVAISLFVAVLGTIAAGAGAQGANSLKAGYTKTALAIEDASK